MSGTLDFSQIIRSERDRKGLTQAQLGQRVGVSDSYIAHIESGLKTPSLDVTIALAETFGFTSQQQQALLEALENSRLERSTRRIRTRGRAIRGAIRTMKQTGPGAVRLLDADSGAMVSSVATGREIRLLCYSHDGFWLAGADPGGAIYVWNAENGELAGNITASDRAVAALALRHRGTQIIATSGDSILTVFDVRTGSRIDDIETELDGITYIASSADDAFIAAGDGEGSIGVWAAGNAESAWVVQAHDQGIACLAFAPDSEVVASGSADGRVQLWQTASGEEELAVEHGGTVTALSFSPDRQLLASGSSDGTVELWNANDGEAIRVLEADVGAVVGLAFRTDGVTLSAVYSTGISVAWDTRTGAARRKVELKDGPYATLALARDARRIAAFDPAFDAVPDEYDPERIARDLAGDRDLLAAYRDLKTAMAGSAEQRKAVLTTLRALARDPEA